MSNTKSNPDTLIASFLLPWKVTNHSTGKEQPNNHKKPCAWILPVLQCLQNPRGLSLFQGKFSQKVKKPKSFRLFEFFEFSNFSTFRLFDFFEFFDFSSRNLLACELFDFSRANIVIFTVWPIPARRAHSENSGEHQNHWYYCGWKKFCTTLDDWNPINNGIIHLSTGAGFLPSTVVNRSSSLPSDSSLMSSWSWPWPSGEMNTQHC